MALRCSAPASNSSVTAPQPAAASRCCRIVFHAGSPAQRQLFHTDFRFAPSPRRASLAGPPIHEDMVVHGLCGRVPDSAGNVSSWIASAQTDANLSAHLPRLPTPPPYLRQMRLLHGRGAGVWCWMRLLPAKGAGVTWQMMLLVVRVAGVGWQMLLLVVRGAVPANHRAHESLF